MPRDWPDRDPRPPSRFERIEAVVIAALIGVFLAFLGINLVRGVMGYGWNW